MRNRKVFFVNSNHQRKGGIEVLEAKEAGSLAGGNKLEQEGLFFLSHGIDNLPEHLYILIAGLALFSMIVRVGSPVPDINFSSSTDEIVELSITEHRDPTLVDDSFETPSDEVCLPF